MIAENQKIKLIDWNVNSIRKRFSLILLLIRDHDPDFLLLQETKVQLDDKFKKLLLRLGYTFVESKPVKGRAGVAIVSRFSCKEMEFQLPLLEARYKEIYVKKLDLRVASFYVPLGMTYVKSTTIDNITDPRYDQEVMKNKLLFLRFLKQRFVVAKRRKQRFLMGGDYNVIKVAGDAYFAMSSVELEKRSEQVLTSKLEREFINDLFSLSNGKEVSGFTFYDYKNYSFQRNLGLKIDTVWSTSLSQVNGKLLYSYRSKPNTSDHLPTLWTYTL